MRRARGVVLVAAFAVAVSALMARVHPFGDAGLYRAEAPRAPLLEHAAIPLEVRELLVTKCADCHSMETRAPLYGRFAPVSWLMALKKAHVVWDDQTLERWLADPDAFLPGNDMDFLVTRPDERKDLIAYLKQSAGK